jgi:hypothetical protein
MKGEDTMKYQVTTKFWTINADGTLVPRTEIHKAKFKLWHTQKHEYSARISLTAALKKKKEYHELWISRNPLPGDYGCSENLKGKIPTENDRYYAGCHYTPYEPRFFENFQDACQYLYLGDEYFETHPKELGYLSHEGCREFYELVI